MAVVLACALAGFLALTSAGSAQGQTSLFVDVVTAGNSASSIGAVDDCVEVDVGDTVVVDIGVSDVSNLTAWETTLIFDQDVLELQDRDPRLFLADNANSRLTVQSDLSAPGPIFPGGLFIGAADTNLNATESGSGILARVTFKAIDEGISNAWMPQSDLDANGSADLGPWLRRLEGDAGSAAEVDDVTDLNGDGYFDGDVSAAVIVVGGDCSEVEPPAPTAPPTPGVPPSDDPDAPGADPAGGGGGTGGGGGSGSDDGDETSTPPPAVFDPEDDDDSEDAPGGGQAAGDDDGGGSSGLPVWVWGLIGLAGLSAAGGALAFSLGAYRRRYP
jgi:hypothetical protein